jgi:dTDP-glucose 4,6-dehydratase
LRRLLVTGGAGFIGANFVRYWLRSHPGERVVVLDALTYAGSIASLADLHAHPELRFVRGDIRDTDRVSALLREERIDTIVHFAAESHVDRSISGPDAFIETNVVGTHSMLKAARRVWLEEQTVAAHRFHHVSTDEVYGSLGPDDAPVTEATAYAPCSPYSASKAASDHLVRAYHRTYGLDVTASNCSNNYGPYHFPEKLIPLAIVNLLQGKPVPVYGDGRHIREWLHVEDHCRALDLILHRGRSGEVFNVSGGAGVENIQLIQQLCSVMDAAFHAGQADAARFPNVPCARGAATASLITYVADRPGHDRRYAVDSRKIAEQLGYRATIDLARGLQVTVQWYLDNESWWRAVVDGSYRRVNEESVLCSK